MYPPDVTQGHVWKIKCLISGLTEYEYSKKKGNYIGKKSSPLAYILNNKKEKNRLDSGNKAREKGE